LTSRLPGLLFALALATYGLWTGQAERDFLVRAVREPASLLAAPAELQGAPGWEELLRHATTVIPPAATVDFVAPSALPPATLYAYYQAAYALYPRRVTLVPAGSPEGPTPADTAAALRGAGSDFLIVYGLPTAGLAALPSDRFGRDLLLVDARVLGPPP
jgi:hypothetical protein